MTDLDTVSLASSNSSITCHRVRSSAWWFTCDFSPEELFILRSSFTSVKDKLENVAISAFTKLFDIRPDAFAVFVGKRVLPSTRDEVRYSWETRQHGMRVLSIVERCLNRMDRCHLFEDVVGGLAARHLSYGAKPVYLLVCPSFFFIY